jgi:hypothetical protein
MWARDVPFRVLNWALTKLSSQPAIRKQQEKDRLTIISPVTTRRTENESSRAAGTHRKPLCRCVAGMTSAGTSTCLRCCQDYSQGRKRNPETNVSWVARHAWYLRALGSRRIGYGTNGSNPIVSQWRLAERTCSEKLTNEKRQPQHRSAKMKDIDWGSQQPCLLAGVCSNEQACQICSAEQACRHTVEENWEASVRKRLQHSQSGKETVHFNAPKDRKDIGIDAERWSKTD